jgi:hypothetical protein
LPLLSEITTAPDGAAIRVGASFVGEAVSVPERARAVGDVLEWSAWLSPWESPEVRLDEACLHRFVRLADAPSTRIAEFALRYGPLYLGPNGLPVALADDLPSRVDEDESLLTGALAVSGATDARRRVWHQEPLEGWRAWARYIRTILVLWHGLREADQPIDPAWRLKQFNIDPGPEDLVFHAGTPLLARDESGEFWLSELGSTVSDLLWPRRVMLLLDDRRSAHEQWEMLAGEVSSRLLEVAGFTVHLRGTRDNPQLELEQPWNRRLGRDVDSAFPTIVGQLLATNIGGVRVQRCADCGMPYPVQRRRKNGRCPLCRPLARSKSVQRSKVKRREREALLARG